MLEGGPKAPSSIAPHVPKSVDEVVLRALEQDPDHRFQSAREMAAYKGSGSTDDAANFVCKAP